MHFPALFFLVLSAAVLSNAKGGHDPSIYPRTMGGNNLPTRSRLMSRRRSLTNKRDEPKPSEPNSSTSQLSDPNSSTPQLSDPNSSTLSEVSDPSITPADIPGTKTTTTAETPNEKDPNKKQNKDTKEASEEDKNSKPNSDLGASNVELKSTSDNTLEVDGTETGKGSKKDSVSDPKNDKKDPGGGQKIPDTVEGINTKLDAERKKRDILKKKLEAKDARITELEQRLARVKAGGTAKKDDKPAAKVDGTGQSVPPADGVDGTEVKGNGKPSGGGEKTENPVPPKEKGNDPPPKDKGNDPPPKEKANDPPPKSKGEAPNTSDTNNGQDPTCLPDGN